MQIKSNIIKTLLFIHSSYFYSASLLRGAPDSDTVSESRAEAPQTTVSEGLAQGHYVAARSGFEPATLRTNGAESTNEPPCPTNYVMYKLIVPNNLNFSTQHVY